MAVSMTPAMQAEIRILPGNDKCVDCGSNHPQWASVTYGALMCLECSGAHRGMGVQRICHIRVDVLRADGKRCLEFRDSIARGHGRSSQRGRELSQAACG